MRERHRCGCASHSSLTQPAKCDLLYGCALVGAEECEAGVVIVHCSVRSFLAYRRRIRILKIRRILKTDTTDTQDGHVPQSGYVTLKY